VDDSLIKKAMWSVDCDENALGRVILLPVLALGESTLPPAPAPASSSSYAPLSRPICGGGSSIRHSLYGDYLDTILLISNANMCDLIPPEQYNLTLLYCCIMWNMRGSLFNLLGAFSRRLPDDAVQDPIKWLLGIMCISSHFPNVVDSINMRFLLLKINEVVRSLKDVSNAVYMTRYQVYVSVTSLVAQEGVTPIEYREFVEYINYIVSELCNDGLSRSFLAVAEVAAATVVTV
jgi:hypothetical protein